MSKPRQQQHQKPLRYSLENLNARPVTPQDKWCYKPTIRDGKPCSEKAWGYIITLPSISKGRKTILDSFTGYTILRCKKLQRQFLLQIIPCDSGKQYGITSQLKEDCPYFRQSKRRKNRHIMNIRNLKKGN